MYQVAAQRSGMPCLIESLIANPPSQDGTDKDQRDLIAQESAALWGFWIAVFALLQLAATIVGLIFIKRTLDATWKAVEDTGKATHEMQEANSIARKISAAELRPYLFVEKLEIADLVIAEPEIDPDTQEPRPYGPPMTGRLAIYLKNFGKVPARNIKVYCKTYFGSMLDGRFWRYNFKVINTWVCAPGHQRRAFGPFLVKGIERTNFDLGFTMFIVRLRITFEDEAGTVYQEHAAFNLTGRDLKTFYLLSDFNFIRATRERARRRRQQLELDMPKPKKRRPRRRKRQPKTPPPSEPEA